MDQTELLDKKVGTKETTSLSAKPVLVLGIAVDSVLGKKGGKNEGKEVGKKLVLICKHPDKDEPLRISEMRFLKGESIKTSTIWVNLDEDGNIGKGSPVAILLESRKIPTLRELESKTLETILDTNGYLCIKAY